jgi:hypothetical protein
MKVLVGRYRYRRFGIGSFLTGNVSFVAQEDEGTEGVDFEISRE